MTPDKLRKYRSIKAEIRAIEEQIRTAYFTIQSPRLDKVDSGKLSATTPGSPTERALEVIEKLTEKKKKLEAFTDEIDDWIETVSDHYIASICRYHYILGLTWDETAEQIYKNSTGGTVRKAAQRYFDTYKV